jgi:integrase
MGKRGNGEGGISRRKDGLYMARYTIQTPTGSKRKTLYGKTRREVDEKLTKAKADRDGGLVFDADNLKLGEYLERWLVDSVRDTVRPTTCERYEQMVRLHIRPVLGKVKLKNLTSAHVRGLYRQKLDAGLSPRSVQYIHVTLHKALKQAIADGLIPRNVTEAVKPPQVSREETLRSHLEHQLGEIDEAGGLWRENGLIFASEAGEPLDRRYITTHRFKPLLKRAKLPQIRFHDLRHTCATLLLSKNVNPKVVSEMLGHASIAITLDTYSHVLPNMQESAAKAMEEALS